MSDTYIANAGGPGLFVGNVGGTLTSPVPPTEDYRVTMDAEPRETEDAQLRVTL